MSDGWEADIDLDDGTTQDAGSSWEIDDRDRSGASSGDCWEDRDASEDDADRTDYRTGCEDDGGDGDRGDDDSTDRDSDRGIDCDTGTDEVTRVDVEYGGTGSDDGAPSADDAPESLSAVAAGDSDGRSEGDLDESSRTGASSTTGGQPDPDTAVVPLGPTPTVGAPAVPAVGIDLTASGALGGMPVSMAPISYQSMPGIGSATGSVLDQAASVGREAIDFVETTFGAGTFEAARQQALSDGTIDAIIRERGIADPTALYYAIEQENIRRQAIIDGR